MTRERVAILSTKCAAAKAALKEQEDPLWEKEIECKVLQLSLTKESGRCAELEETCGGLRISKENGQKMIVDLLARLEKSKEAYDEAVKRLEWLITTAERRENMHVKKLAKVEARRAEEIRIAEELRGKIAEAKTAEEDLRSKIGRLQCVCVLVCDPDFKHSALLFVEVTASGVAVSVVMRYSAGLLPKLGSVLWEWHWPKK
ncbi:hypothetical protein AXG93_1855s1060 [Marchantia polymorpha subsp. ruderalis]|uniref:Uncharacterized protein n=1 Tax=Marchantia polymorpha subsp. ruderalis TaxID=1480154 RepID=A0A176VPC4_MARPO|nr:hypothetical protein AXG93_1855s1060 [Marchantia polymorpha subsp. ruderalis]